MMINISKEVENAIDAAVRSGQFASAGEMIDTLVRQYAQQAPHLQPASPEPPQPADRPIWEEILELTADVPDEEWDKRPTDLAEQHDH